MANAKVETTADRTREERKVERVAVLFTHGQGEQVPMQDVVQLAQSVWTLDPASVESDPPVSRDVWSVPVYDADMSEQRRLVTSTLRRPNGDDLQVDFYQFYWADLMTGNRFVHLWWWFMTLMKRDKETPEPLEPIRKAAMNVALGVGVLGWVFGLITLARLVDVDYLSWANLFAVVMLGAVCFQTYFLTARSRRAPALIGGLGLIVASLLLGGASMHLLKDHCQVVELMQSPLGEGCDGVSSAIWPAQVLYFPLAEWVSRVHSAFAGSLILLMIPLIYVGVQLDRSFLVPVMADSARMLSATPENLPARDRIRKRGMELMEALHNSERRYDRIVFLAHSLGTVVAYNVLMQYWGNVYRLFNHSASNDERAAAEAAAAKLKAAAPDAVPTARLAFRAKVRAYYQALCDRKSRLDPNDVEWRTSEYASDGHLLRNILKALRTGRPNAQAEEARSPWLVSDFITIGSPLTYGSLLMAESNAEFEAQVKVRRYAVCPPSETTKGSFTHAERPHHAAVFGVTCWTNIFFETEGLVKGDIIGGELGKDPPGGFGRGVLDVAVRRELDMPKFAHNEYWRWRTTITGEPAEHVLALRSALHLFGDSAGADQSLKILAPPRI